MRISMNTGLSGSARIVSANALPLGKLRLDQLNSALMMTFRGHMLLIRRTHARGIHSCCEFAPARAAGNAGGVGVTHGRGRGSGAQEGADGSQQTSAMTFGGDFFPPFFAAFAQRDLGVLHPGPILHPARGNDFLDQPARSFSGMCGSFLRQRRPLTTK